MKYPSDIVTSDGWARIHQGHGLERSMLADDLMDNHYPCGSEQDLKVEEVHLGYASRVKWCEQFGDGACDQQGEWHGHWYTVRPEPAFAYTIVRWSRATVSP